MENNTNIDTNAPQSQAGVHFGGGVHLTLFATVVRLQELITAQNPDNARSV